ncbi:MAG: Gfo/Idh/MocA family oxidoreductase [Nocardioides sp.]
MSVKLVFLGITHPHSSARYRALEAVEGVEIVGAWDQDATALAAFCEEVAAVRLDRLPDLATGVDGAIIHSKSAQMAELAMAAAGAGCGVLIEKPGGAGLADLAALSEVEADMDKPMWVGFSFRFSEAFTRAKAAFDAGVVGTAPLIHGHGASSQGEHLTRHLNQEADMGGGLWVIGTHVIHLLLELCGRPQAVSARVLKLNGVSDERSREDVASLALRYPDRLVTYNFTVHDNREWFESSEITVYGDQGSIVVGVLPERLEYRLNQASNELPAGVTSWAEGGFAVPWNGPSSGFSELPQIQNLAYFERESVAFVDVLRGGTSDGVTVTDAFDVACVVKAAYVSETKGGAEVLVDDIAGGV